MLIPTSQFGDDDLSSSGADRFLTILGLPQFMTAEVFFCLWVTEGREREDRIPGPMTRNFTAPTTCRTNVFEARRIQQLVYREP
jgi:hypothetical protein